MNCPICDSPLTEDKSYLDEGTLCECYDGCPNGCYYYEFAYGAYRETIGPEEWTWSYTESDEARRDRVADRAEIIKRMRAS